MQYFFNVFDLRDEIDSWIERFWHFNDQQFLIAKLIHLKLYEVILGMIKIHISDLSDLKIGISKWVDRWKV